MRLSQEPAGEFAHEEAVKEAARHFVKESPTTWADLDRILLFHTLFSVRPRGDSQGARRIPVADIATDRIMAIISYAAAASPPHQQWAFYRYIISQHMLLRWFTASTAGYLFTKLVLTWLSSGLGVGTLLCTSIGWPDLRLPACGEKQTTYFRDLDALNKIKVDTFPFCLLPRYPSTHPVDAIILTDQFIITIQVTISHTPGHSARQGGFTAITDSLPTYIRDGRNWCHVFITDEEWKVQRLRGQNLSSLWDDIHVYSGVYDIGQRDIISGRSWALDEDNVRGPVFVAFR